MFYNNIKYVSCHENSDNPDILLIETNNNFDIYGYSSMKANKIINFRNEIINYKGDIYKLDCILLFDKDITHIISGLTCSGSKYVYNGWWKIKGSPCNLMLFDWLSNMTIFCLNEMDCNLSKDLNRTDLCFNFKDNERLKMNIVLIHFLQRIFYHLLNKF